jgi:hypothetical protein
MAAEPDRPPPSLKRRPSSPASLHAPRLALLVRSVGLGSVADTVSVGVRSINRPLPTHAAAHVGPLGRPSGRGRLSRCSCRGFYRWRGPGALFWRSQVPRAAVNQGRIPPALRMREQHWRNGEPAARDGSGSSAEWADRTERDVGLNRLHGRRRGSRIEEYANHGVSDAGHRRRQRLDSKVANLAVRPQPSGSRLRFRPSTSNNCPSPKAATGLTR